MAAAGSASANTTYFKCSEGNVTGESASFSMAQGVGGFTIDGMNFISNQAGGDGDIEKDDKGNTLLIVKSTILQRQPYFKWSQDLKITQANGKVRELTCESLPDDYDVQRMQAPVSPVRGSGGNCDSYYGTAADGSQCGLRSADSRVRPY